MTYIVEYERKFLVADPAPLEYAGSGTHIQQGYLVTRNNRTVRVRVSEDEITLNIKQSSPAALRPEAEDLIDSRLANKLLLVCDPYIVKKERYPVVDAGRMWAVDVFLEDNEGLILAEVEASYGEDLNDLEIPEWCGQEVTGDERFYNEYLAYHPYTTW